MRNLQLHLRSVQKLRLRVLYSYSFLTESKDCRLGIQETLRRSLTKVGPSVPTAAGTRSLP